MWRRVIGKASGHKLGCGLSCQGPVMATILIRLGMTVVAITGVADADAQRRVGALLGGAGGATLG